MDDLVQFLSARLDEDARAAKLMAEFYPVPWDVADRGWMAHVMADGPGYREVVRLEQWSGMPDGKGSPDLGEIIEHIARHDPARVLADVDAKRQIIAEYERYAAERRRAMGGWYTAEASLILAALASVYADHPDYRAEWRP